MKMIESRKSVYFKIAIVALAIVLIGSFWLSARLSAEPVSLAVNTTFPKGGGEPMLVTFKLNNPTPLALPTSYEFFANGQLLARGDTVIPGASAETHQYAYRNALNIGEQVSFVVRSQSALGGTEKALSLPSYPPQVLSSIVSISSIATSEVGAMNSIAYYQSAFGDRSHLNLSFITALILITLLIFMELTQPVIRDRTIACLGRLRIRFSTLSWILLVIFLGIVYTRVILIITSL